MRYRRKGLIKTRVRKENASVTGRPSDYTQEIADTICERLSNGESLRSICSSEEMPSKAAVCRWLAKHESFRDQYARAREIQADAHFDEMLDIADDAANDWMRREGKDGEGSYAVNGEHIQRSRLRVDARKWVLGKLNPKKYGDKIINEHSGPDGGPIQTEHSSTIADLPAEKRALLRQLLADEGK